MVEPKDVDPLVEKILANQPGDYFKRLTDMCMPLMLDCRGRWFWDVEDAILRHRDEKGGVLRYLQNSFRNVCLQERRAMRIRKVSEVAQALGLSDALAVFEPSAGRMDEPEHRVVLKEAFAKIIEAMREYHPTCLAVILRHLRGSSFGQIAERIGGDAAKCRAMSWHNFLHMRKIRKRDMSGDEEMAL